MQGLIVNGIESSHKEKGIHKAKAALRHSTMEIQSKKDQKITKWVRFHYEYKDGHGPGSQQPGDAKISSEAKQECVMIHIGDDDEDGHGSQQPGNAKISSEAEQGCKDIPPPVAGSKWRPRVLHSEERNLMAVPVAVGPQEREVEEPLKSRSHRSRAARAICSSHTMMKTGQFVFCQVCGAYTAGRHSSALRATCVGYSSNTARGREAYRRARRLSNGHDPITGKVVGHVQRWQA